MLLVRGVDIHVRTLALTSTASMTFLLLEVDFGGLLVCVISCSDDREW